MNNHYEDWIRDYKEGNLLIVDVDHLDYASNPEDLAVIVHKIDAELHGLFSPVRD